MTACFNPISMTLESAKLWRELEKANQPTKQQRSVVAKDFKGAMDKRIKKQVVSGASQCSVHYYNGTQVVTHMTAHRGHTTQRKPDVNRRLWVMSSNGSLPSVENAPCWYRTLRVEEAVTGWGQKAHGDSVPSAQLSHEPGNCSKNVHS